MQQPERFVVCHAADATNESFYSLVPNAMHTMTMTKAKTTIVHALNHRTMKLEDVKKELGRHLQDSSSPLHGVKSLYGGPFRPADRITTSLCIPANALVQCSTTLPPKATDNDDNEATAAALFWDNATRSTTSIDAFLLYLEMSDWLRTVKVTKATVDFDVTVDFRAAVTKFFMSLTKNKNIGTFICTTWLPSDALGHYLARAPSLHTIQLEVESLDGKDFCENIANNLAMNRTVMSLSITHGLSQSSSRSQMVLGLLDHPTLRLIRIEERVTSYDTSRMFVTLKTPSAPFPKGFSIHGKNEIESGFAQILAVLPEHATVNYLLLHGSRGQVDEPPFEAFPVLLFGSKAQVEKLVLCQFQLTMDSWFLLQKCTCALMSLDLFACTFDDDVTIDFVHSVGRLVPHLSLHLSHNRSSRKGQNSLDTVAAMLLYSRDSALRSLQLHSVDEGRVRQILREGRDSDLQIETLQLDKIYQSDITAIAKSLPWCTSLRALIVCSDVCRFPDAVLDGFRQNGSLQDVVLKGTLNFETIDDRCTLDWSFLSPKSTCQTVAIQCLK
jgi:hypothetical protein